MKQIFLIFLLLATTVGFPKDEAGLKLWCNKPSGDTWENALPTGNGKLSVWYNGGPFIKCSQSNLRIKIHFLKLLYTPAFYD